MKDGIYLAGFVIGLTECHGVKAEEIVNIWNAYIDESGTHRESSNIVVAATLASGKTWQELVPEWEAVLDHYGLSHFHAVDFNGGTGECANMAREERVDCVKRLVQVAGDASLEYIAYAIKRDLYESRDSDLGVYDYLLASTISDIAIWGAEHGIDGMYVFIESGCSLSTNLCDLFRNAAPKRKYLEPIGNIGYLDKKHVPLQVADMIAYETFKYLDNQIRTPMKPMRKSFKKIIDGNPLSAYRIDDALLDYELPIVQRFIDKIGERK